MYANAYCRATAPGADGIFEPSRPLLLWFRRLQGLYEQGDFGGYRVKSDLVIVRMGGDEGKAEIT